MRTYKVINIKKVKFLGKKRLASKFNNKTYLGNCSTCLEQCGSFMDAKGLVVKKKNKQLKLKLV